MKHPVAARVSALVLGMIAVFLLTACSTAPKSEADRAQLESDAMETLALAKKNDASLASVLNDAAGYAVFPKVGKGGVGIGGAYGKGVLFENGAIVGYCDLTQATIGFQLGGQTYAEIIAFEDATAVNVFKTNRFKLGAQATAVALKSGVSANAKYTDGVAVFTMAQSGLMYEATIGGQKFDYLPR